MGKLLLAGCIAVALLAEAATAEAAPPRFKLGDTDCGIHELSGVGGIGLATDLPRVYAADVTRRRDLQYVRVRTDLYHHNGSRWVQVVKGDVYKALASDNNYVISFRNTRTGEYMLFPNERLQFVLKTSGAFAVSQQIVWDRNRRVRRRYKTGFRWVQHSPRAPNGGNYCWIT